MPCSARQARPREALLRALSCLRAELLKGRPVRARHPLNVGRHGSLPLPQCRRGGPHRPASASEVHKLRAEQPQSAAPPSSAAAASWWRAPSTRWETRRACSTLGGSHRYATPRLIPDLQGCEMRAERRLAVPPSNHRCNARGGPRAQESRGASRARTLAPRALVIAVPLRTRRTVRHRIARNLTPRTRRRGRARCSRVASWTMGPCPWPPGAPSERADPPADIPKSARTSAPAARVLR